MMNVANRNIKYSDIGDLLNYLFPNVDDWVHNKSVPGLMVNGEKVKLRPTYRSEKLKLIILYEYVSDFPISVSPLQYIYNLEKKRYIFQKAGYRVVEIPSYLSIKKIKEYFDKNNYIYYKNNRTYNEPRYNEELSIADDNDIYIGNRVKVLDLDFDEVIEYVLVEAFDIDLINNKISIDSPIGKALLGKRVNEIIEVPIPEGIAKLKILEIS